MSKSIKILLVEDDPLDADLSISHLEADGFQCAWQRVQTKNDLISALETERFDLLLIDYNLPGFDGLTALSIIQRFELDVPVIFVTGNLKAELAIESIKAGAVDFVHKDRLTRLSSSVQRALDEFALRRADRIKNAELNLFRALNDVANSGADFDTLAKRLVALLPSVLESQEIAFYLRSFEKNTLLLYNFPASLDKLEKIEKLLKIKIPALEVPLDADNIYARSLHEQAIKVIEKPEEIESFYELYLKVAKFPNGVEKSIRTLIPKIIAIMGYEKIALYPMIEGGQV